jgi:hypothetical protein
LALIVNGLYFISLFTPAARPARPHLFSHAREVRVGNAATSAPPDYALQPGYVPLPPPTAPSHASAYHSGGQLHVSLTKDLTLIKRPGRTLLLSPSFNAPLNPSGEPDAVRLNFIIYSDKETCPAYCPLTINADGRTVWTSYLNGDPLGWQREHVPHSSEKLADGQVVETMAAESLSTLMSYKEFIDMISAKRVIVRLGPDWVELTADQIEALRDMHRRLPQPPPDDTTSS